MHSVISAWARCGLVNIKAPNLRGNRSSLLAYDYSLGARAAKLSERVFLGDIRAAEIVDNHSHVPLYASFMTVLQAFAWRERLIDGVPGRDSDAIAIRKLSLVEAQSLRRCPSCVHEDQDRYGCAHWRVFHQWPVARHCAVHGDALETHCRACKSPFIRTNEPSLADDPCATCGARGGVAEAFDAPAGYGPLLKLLHRASEGLAPELGTLVRAHRLLQSDPWTWGQASADKEATADLRVALGAWDVASIDELAALLGANWIWRMDPARGRGMTTCPAVVQAAVAAMAIGPLHSKPMLQLVRRL